MDEDRDKIQAGRCLRLLAEIHVRPVRLLQYYPVSDNWGVLYYETITTGFRTQRIAILRLNSLMLMSDVIVDVIKRPDPEDRKRYHKDIRSYAR